jgi:archaeal type IV pilus assembly protein PilA
MNFGKQIRKFRKNARAISPVIATLLMIAIAVVASLVTYAWVMGYMSFQTEKTGKAIQIQSATYSGTSGDVFTVYVQNVGDSPVSLSGGLYINGGLATSITIKDTSGATITSIAEGSTAVFSGTTTSLGVGVQSVTIKVTTTDGTFSEMTKQFTIV